MTDDLTSDPERQREVDAWPEWKRRAADQALVTTGEPDATEGPACTLLPADEEGAIVDERLAWLRGRGLAHEPTYVEAFRAGWQAHRRYESTTAEPPEPDEARQLWCPECGAVDGGDEDGCCHQCGATIVTAAVVDSITAPHRARAEGLQADVDRLTREPDEDLPDCIEVHGDDRIGWGWDPAESTQLPCCWTRAEAEAQARAFVDSITAPFRARAETAERERDTLRALLERCLPVVAAEVKRCADITWGDASDYLTRCRTLLTDIRTALRQSKGAEP